MRLLREIVVDNFAGGGGASTGIELAIGRSVDIAINHDPAAVAMHMVNHPETKHFCESVWEVDPREVTGGQPVGLCWLSPDCKHFSKAKGGKPVEKKIRGLAWVALRWAATVKPRVIMLENVEEFTTWGPIKDGRPDPKQKGREFRAFVNALRRQGYNVEWRELRACDYGAPTIRKRLFLIARCDGRPIVWPDPTHGDPVSPAVKSGKLLPWRTAAEIIDWSLPCPSIFERKKPLAPNTLRRIARGIMKFVVNNPKPFVIRFTQSGFGGDGMQYPADQPLTTIMTKAEHALVVPHITKFRTGATGSAADAPLPTITSGAGSVRPAGAAHALGMVTAFLTQYHSETASHDARGQVIDRPVLTLDTSNRYGLITSHLVKMKGTNVGQRADEPLQTVTAGGNHFGEVRAFLMAYYGSSVGQELSDPLGTVTTHDRFGLVTILGQDYQIVDIGMRMLEPRELFAAQGFPAEYVIDRDAHGRKFPKDQQVARCGNSVSPVIPAALVRANLPEMCKQVPYKSGHQLELQLV